MICRQKRCFPHRMAAEHALRVGQAITKYLGVEGPREIYRCKRCGWWHLTKLSNQSGSGQRCERRLGA